MASASKPVSSSNGNNSPKLEDSSNPTMGFRSIAQHTSTLTPTPSTGSIPLSVPVSQKSIQSCKDSITYMGRFEPYHPGHDRVVEQAFETTNILIIVIGSKNKSRTQKNPFNYQERKEMISRSIDQHIIEDSGKFYAIIGQDDCDDDEQWTKEVCEKVKIQQIELGLDPESGNHGLIGFNKDKSSYYLDSFPQWQCIEAAPYRYQDTIISATDIRNLLFKSTKETLSEEEDQRLKTLLLEPVKQWIDTHKEILDECHSGSAAKPDTTEPEQLSDTVK